MTSGISNPVAMEDVAIEKKSISRVIKENSQLDKFCLKGI